MNKVQLYGRLTRDVEQRYMPNGNAVGEFGLAINRSWTGDDGQRKESTVFVDITVFGKQCETLAQYTKKGDPLIVEGRLALDQWEDKQTQQKRSKLKVVLESFHFVGGKRSEEQGEPAPEPRQRPSAAKKETAPVPSPDDEDVPF
jgi:single-strand DNA-binding protein